MSGERSGTRKRRRRCPRCGQLGALPVMFGMVPAMDPESERMILAGCEVMPDAPDYVCRQCARELGLVL